MYLDITNTLYHMFGEFKYIIDPREHGLTNMSEIITGNVKCVRNSPSWWYEGELHFLFFSDYTLQNFASRYNTTSWLQCFCWPCRSPTCVVLVSCCAIFCVLNAELKFIWNANLHTKCSVSNMLAEQYQQLWPNMRHCKTDLKLRNTFLVLFTHYTIHLVTLSEL